MALQRDSNNGTHIPTLGRSDNASAKSDRQRSWRLWSFLALLVVDLVASFTFLTPVVPKIRNAEGLTASHYSLHGSLWDLAILSVLRVLSACLAILISFYRSQPPEPPFKLYNDKGERKSRAELEAEALEEPFGSQLRRHVFRLSFVTEFFVLLTSILLGLKCLSRLNVEIGIYGDKHPQHPVFWIALAASAMLSLLESIHVDSIEMLAAKFGQERRNEGRTSVSWLDRIGESLVEPLLSRVNSEINLNEDQDEERGEVGRNENRRIKSDIRDDAHYTASWEDFLATVKPDAILIACSVLCLTVSSVASVFIPKFTGEILDALVANSSGNNSTLAAMSSFSSEHEQIVQIPGFIKNIELLVLASLIAGIFEGVRGAIFNVVGARVNVRLRIKLMDSLLSQDIGFYDTTRTGDITSRLSSDTTLVGSSITSQVDVILRSTMRATGTLIFMFSISWQLSLLAFMTVPAVAILSRWYGRYLRRLSKHSQKKLAEGNNVSESTISSMATVRAFGAEDIELNEFENCMQNYLSLNRKSAIATFGYGTCVGALPQLVKALVLFYGGLFVQSNGSDHISGGQLVSFILYLSALAESFNNLGGVYASLVRAIGAADKVFELMHREPQLTPPSHIDQEKVHEALIDRHNHPLGIETRKTAKMRAEGLYPRTCVGEVTLQNVEFRYPARPQQTVLDGMNLTIPPGSVVALVGTSGSGKSSVVKLIQHLYEVNTGQVCIDAIPVHELSKDWLCQHVSVVSQEPTLFARSIRRNIIYGLENSTIEPTQDEIEEAARLANASFIEQLPEKYETQVGERGIQLSGGQKQRIAIARALVRKPRILLLDEATSALDSESEHVVQQAIDNMISGQRSLDGDPSNTMTVIIVAHRLSTIRNADCIYVMKEGKVVEQGNHDNLVGIQNGVYNGLIRRQLGHIDTINAN